MTVQTYPVRLGPAETALVGQLETLGDSAGAERLRMIGLPTRRVESYHYTDLKTLLRAVPDLAGTAQAASPPALNVPGAFRLMIANGTVQDAGTAPAGVIVGKVKGGVLSQRDDVMVRLNTALIRESLDLNLDGTVDPVIHIDRRAEGPAGHVGSSASTYLGDGSSAILLETFSGSDAAHLTNHASVVSLGRNARLTHIVVDLSGPEVSHFATVEYLLAEGAQLRSIVIQAGSKLARTQVFARFGGERSHADFTGLNLTDDGQHCDFTLDVAHAVANTTSKELFKAVARGRSKAVFQGRIVVARDAQKVDAKMMTNGLMLSDEAEILAKPELEIYADDVVCGHGATCGDLDETSLFYLMSRGIPKPEAETMLVRAFIEDVIEPLAHDELREVLTAMIDDWLVKAK
jgi:Fe-S cluster assembly protein SufD